MEDLSVDGRILKRAFKKRDGTWIGLILFRMGIGGGLL